MKTNFSARPVYHKKGDRIKCHFLICYTALLICRLMEVKLRMNNTPHTINEIQKTMKKTDQARRGYYAHYAGRTWGDRRNFHLCLDTGALGYDTCVKLICEAARGME